MADICFIHYCEGAGHATRMLSVVEEMDDSVEVGIAGGGPGQKFVEMNGYSEFVPEQVDFIELFRSRSGLSFVGELGSSYRRTRDLTQWLRQESPEVACIDDLFGALAASITGTDFVFIKHDSYGIYSNFSEALGAELWNRFISFFSEDLLMPVLWEPPSYGEEIGPLALEKGECSEEHETIIVPSAYSRNEDLSQENGVTVVGDRNWKDKESLLPCIRKADRVICSGYSTAMECALARTTCVIVPETSEQKGVAKKISESEIEGFRTASSYREALNMQIEEEPNPRESGVRETAEILQEKLGL